MSRTNQAQPLTDLAERFVAEYLIDLNATAAYARASGNDKERSNQVNGSRMLKDPRVNAAVVAGKQRQIASKELTATRVLEELRRCAMFDPADFYDPKTGKLRPLMEIPPEARAVIAGLDVARANLDRTDGKNSEEWLHKIKLANKLQALEILAKHFALLKDVVQVEGDWDKLAARLAAARQRVTKK